MIRFVSIKFSSQSQSHLRHATTIQLGSQRGIEQTHDEVDQLILEEFTGRVYYDVGGFYERYFEGKSWTNNAKDIYEESRAQYTEGRWSGRPEPSIQGPFLSG
ncbi:hypothetical protein DL95DRAFT_470923 [Leptodontidium sp. 2 PMI_412]|nr:hypothetical protein DL95DRAFT_470923 [Leptodontidium sp. 2 PMI_412]